MTWRRFAWAVALWGAACGDSTAQAPEPRPTDTVLRATPPEAPAKLALAPPPPRFDCTALPELPLGRPFELAPTAGAFGRMAAASPGGVQCDVCDPARDDGCLPMAYYRVELDSPAFLNVSGVVETYLLELLEGCPVTESLHCDSTEAHAGDGTPFELAPGTYVLGLAPDPELLDGDSPTPPRADLMPVVEWARLCASAAELGVGRTTGRSIEQSVVTGGCEHAGGDDALFSLRVARRSEVSLESPDARSITVYGSCPTPSTGDAIVCVTEGEPGPLRLSTPLDAGDYFVLVETGRSPGFRIERRDRPLP